MRMMQVDAADVPTDLLAAHFGTPRAEYLRGRHAVVELPVALLYPPGDTCDADDRTPEEHLAALLEEDRAAAVAEALNEGGAVPAELALDVARRFFRELADRELIMVRTEPD